MIPIEFKRVSDRCPDWHDGGMGRLVEVRLEDGRVMRGVMWASNEGPGFEIEDDDGSRFKLAPDMYWRYLQERPAVSP